MTKRMTNDQLMTQFPNSQGHGRDYAEVRRDQELDARDRVSSNGSLGFSRSLVLGDWSFVSGGMIAFFFAQGSLRRITPLVEFFF